MVVLMFVLLLSGSLSAQVTSTQVVGAGGDVSDDLAGIVREATQSPLPLRIMALPEITDDLIFLKTKGSLATNAEVPPIVFYKVTILPYELKDGRIVSQTVQLDSENEWIVAVDSQRKEHYLLKGFSNAAAEFSRFMAGLKIEIVDANDALSIFDLFLKTVRGERFRSHVIADDMELESVAIEDFRSRFPESKSRAAFESWWRGIPAAERNAIKPPIATPGKAGFVIRYTLYDRGRLRSESIDVNSNGTISEVKVVPRQD